MQQIHNIHITVIWPCHGHDLKQNPTQVIVIPELYSCHKTNQLLINIPSEILLRPAYVCSPLMADLLR